ncbi:MAG: N-(5'-phosphoribosyl)anthranilate isomerase [Cycloclasticus sp. symbiont of Poecilosclerida sp. M]|nr:MAG: N-(5'-phosphoribosyl)anthranilate isomerase [Cycloclasticus sp. symbiont of Poecilosclerida sp. M]
MRTRVKICGITQLDDALSCIENGADALGFVFYEKSVRFIDIEQASKIINKLPPFISKIGLFINANYDYVSSVLQETAIDLLQFHGNEDEVFCQSFGKPYIKAIRMKPKTDLTIVAEQYHSASGLLVDAYDPQQCGGTGHTFDWSALPKESTHPIILAGGLNPNNVAQAISTTHPYAVDVSSGVETSKGVKDHQLIKQFMQEVRRVS